MNEMFDIYKRKADQYEELIKHEDYKQNLAKFLKENLELCNKSICEFGVGTGRVTDIYIEEVKKAMLCDISQHMLDVSKVKLNKYNQKIEYKILDNKNISVIQDRFDIIIEGWSFGHLISENVDACNLWSTTLISECKKLSETIVFIETLGTNVDQPKAPSDLLKHFYDTLKENNFYEHIISTDYRFHNSEQASNVLGAFFGEDMKKSILKDNKSIIKEFTGIWIYNSRK